MIKSIKTCSIILLAFAFIFSSCNSDEDVNPGTPPELPPESSMQMDFSNFEEGDNSGGREATKNHWGTAVVTVATWNVILAAHLAIPVASFKAAIVQEPTYDRGRKVWVWAFDHDILGHKYSFELTGALVTDGVEWKMYASKEGGFQNVMWYYGVTTTDGSSGFWAFNKDGDNPTPFLKIDWTKDNDNIASMTCTNIAAGTDGYGAYIKFGKTDDTDFNRFYKIIGADKAVEIEWNKASGAGRIKVDDDPYLCWDTSFEDVDC